MVPPFGGNIGIYITISHQELATVAFVQAIQNDICNEMFCA